jgi:hypothetical protein
MHVHIHTHTYTHTGAMEEVVTSAEAMLKTLERGSEVTTV